ncbi:MAG: hypothetical protein AAB612_00830, partial [Patescibacteria group bacterium]
QLSSTRGGTGADLSASAQGAVPYFSATGVMSALAPSTAGYLFQTNGAAANPSWVPSAGVGTNYWQLNSPVLTPGNTTLDVAVGGNSTASAKFQVFGVSGNATTSGTLTFNGSTLASNLIAATNMRGLTIGDTNTGNIIFSGGNVGIGTTAPNTKLDVNGTINADGASALITFNDARGIGLNGTKFGFERGGSYFTGFDVLVGASSGLVVDASGQVGIGKTSPNFTLDISGTASISSTLSLGPLTQGGAGSCASANAGKMYYDGPANSYYYCNGSSWTVIGSGAGGGTSYWNQTSGLLFPNNSTVDVAIGGQATSSAKFAFLNVNSGTPTLSFANQASALDLANTTVNALSVEGGLLSLDTQNSRVG